MAVVASRAELSPSLLPTDRGPGSFTLSALRLMTLSDPSQISAIQNMGYLILIKIDTRIFKAFLSYVSC